MASATLTPFTTTTPAHTFTTFAPGTLTGNTYLATGTADLACGEIIKSWATSSHDGYTVTTTVDNMTVSIDIAAGSMDGLADALNALQHAVVPTDAPPLTERQLELFPAVLELDVNRDDILGGVRGNVHECAVAKAVARRFDGAHVSVGGYEVRVWDPETNTPIVYRPTHEMSEFIRRFDHGMAVPSTRFHLERLNEARGALFA
jgi:hypothetical protein